MDEGLNLWGGFEPASARSAKGRFRRCLLLGLVMDNGHDVKRPSRSTCRHARPWVARGSEATRFQDGLVAVVRGADGADSGKGDKQGDLGKLHRDGYCGLFVLDPKKAKGTGVMSV